MRVIIIICEVVSIFFMFLIIIGSLVIDAKSGGWTNDKELLNFLINCEFDGLKEGLRIRATGELITKNNSTLFCSWGIPNIGNIPRWSKSHKYLNKIYKTKFKKGKPYAQVFGIKE